MNAFTQKKFSLFYFYFVLETLLSLATETSKEGKEISFNEHRWIPD